VFVKVVLTAYLDLAVRGFIIISGETEEGNPAFMVSDP
jgi:hypothetical protein